MRLVYKKSRQITLWMHAVVVVSFFLGIQTVYFVHWSFFSDRFGFLFEQTWP